MNQRLVVFITFLLFIGGAILGTGPSPVLPDGTVVDQETITDPTLTFIEAIGMFAALIYAIHRRVMTGSIQAGDFVSMLKTQEFIITVVALFGISLQWLGVQWLADPEKQAALVNLLGALVPVLAISNGARPPGTEPKVIESQFVKPVKPKKAA